MSTSLSVISAPFSSIPLAADTRYWIELSTSTSSLQWSFAAVNDGIGVANEYNLYAGSVSANEAFTPFQMSIGSAVPEPSTWALMLAGFAGLGFVGYRFSRKSAALAHWSEMRAVGAAGDSPGLKLLRLLDPQGSRGAQRPPGRANKLRISYVISSCK